MKIIYLLGLFISILSFSQVGINTTNPAATLHIEPSSINAPSNTDGLLVPRVSQLPNSANAKGQLLFLNSASDKGFYYWTGNNWQKIVDQLVDNTIDETSYIIQGSGYAVQNMNITTENQIVLSNIIAKNTTGFTFPSSNTLRIGKKGTYLVNFISSTKVTSSSNRASFIYRLKRNGTTVSQSSGSVPSQFITATAVSMSSIVSFNEGDLITVTVQKTNENNSNLVYYSGYGNNVISLTFLHD